MNYALGKFAIAICDICGQRYKLHELNTLKNKLKEILGNDPEYFIPKIKYN